jgi:hypothetical protein
MSIQPSASTLSAQIFRRARSAKISAPPPGSEPRPQATNRSSTSRRVMPNLVAKYSISTAVNALMWSSGRSRRMPRSSSS